MYIHVSMHMYCMLVYVYRCKYTISVIAFTKNGIFLAQIRFLNPGSFGFLGIQQDTPEKVPVVLALLQLNVCSQL